MVRETRHLWVGNLPENIREDRIREHFKRYVDSATTAKGIRMLVVLRSVVVLGVFFLLSWWCCCECVGYWGASVYRVFCAKFSLGIRISWQAVHRLPPSPRACLQLWTGTAWVHSNQTQSFLIYRYLLVKLLFLFFMSFTYRHLCGGRYGLLQPGKKHGLERTRIIILCHSYKWFKLIFFCTDVAGW